ncbi:MAG TPA: hypothetical protein VMU15_00055 [Anaeromyxobacter sp.]|nr:hypothetical protein [Anaeromyxobacter sp.]
MVTPIFIQHNGKRILRLDYTLLDPPGVIAFMEEARRLIAGEPQGSVLLLSIVPPHISDAVVNALKGFAAHNVPFVLASAIVGATSFQKAAILLTITSRGRRNVEAFDDERQARDWLVTR